jgi:hypothetical protein
MVVCFCAQGMAWRLKRRERLRVLWLVGDSAGQKKPETVSPVRVNLVLTWEQ